MMILITFLLQNSVDSYCNVNDVLIDLDLDIPKEFNKLRRHLKQAMFSAKNDLCFLDILKQLETNIIQ